MVPSDYSGLALRTRLYFVTWPYSIDRVVDLAEGTTIEGLSWSPDGKSLQVLELQVEGTNYHFDFVPLDAASQTKIPGLGFQLASEKYLLFQPFFWLR